MRSFNRLFVLLSIAFLSEFGLARAEFAVPICPPEPKTHWSHFTDESVVLVGRVHAVLPAGIERTSASSLMKLSVVSCIEGTCPDTLLVRVSSIASLPPYDLIRAIGQGQLIEFPPAEGMGILALLVPATASGDSAISTPREWVLAGEAWECSKVAGPRDPVVPFNQFSYPRERRESEMPTEQQLALPRPEDPVEFREAQAELVEAWEHHMAEARMCDQWRAARDSIPSP